MRMGSIQGGPKENEAAGLPSVWFEYDDGKRFLRQAIAVTADRAVSLILSAPSNDARASHGRAFEQTLRSLSVVTPAEVRTGSDTGSAVPSDAGAATAPSDGAPAQVDAAAPPATPTPTIDAGVEFQPAPTPTINPVGPCN